MTVQICQDKDAACEEFPAHMRCEDCPTLRKSVHAVDTSPERVQKSAENEHETALQRFKENAIADECSPLERLRFFCSLAMNGQDWLDVEQFFDAVVAQPAQIPDDWKLVPVEPTQAMCQEGQWKAKEWPKFPLRISPIYKAMIAAAPAYKEQTNDA